MLFAIKECSVGFNSGPNIIVSHYLLGGSSQCDRLISADGIYNVREMWLSVCYIQ